MLGLRFDGSGVLVVVGLGVLSLQGSVRSQIAAHEEFDRGVGVVRGDGAIDEVTTPEVAATVIVGRVIGPDGAPAPGAVVVTSSGGQAVTNAEGAFSLEVAVPADAESVRVTAVLGSGTASQVGSAQVGAPAHWGTMYAGTLDLEQAAACQPSWIPTFDMGSGVSGPVSALTIFDDGSGPALYAGGTFVTAGGVTANEIAKWNGSSWSALGSGMDGPVQALTVFDDGSGPALYAGGSFSTAGGVAANRIAKWNGSSWSALGSGMNSFGVIALTVYDDGSGPALYAGGVFTVAGGVAVKSIAKWNGTSWSALGSGVGYHVYALAVFDDGSGPALCAGGYFTIAGGVSANYIAKWNGTSWSALGSGMNENIYALTAFDDGTGPALYAGGWFTSAGGVAASAIAKWNGSSWSKLGSGLSGFGIVTKVSALTSFDDGSGLALYAGGHFTSAGGESANYVAKWNGSSWSKLGSGMDNNVLVLAAFDDGGGLALYAGGEFTTSGSVAAKRIAEWGGCSPPPSPWTNLGSGLAGISGIPQLIGSGDLLAGTPGTIHLIDAAPSAPAALFISAFNTPTPFKGGTLLTVPVLLTLPLATDSMGDILLPWVAWPSGLSGVSVYFQYAIQDSAAVKGVALSNALGADVP